MKMRIVAVALGIVAVMGMGTAPASADQGPCLPPAVYPWCG